MDISIANSAFGDLESIQEYYLEQGVPDIGQDFVVSIIEHIRKLIDHPDIGRVVPAFGETHIREIIYPPFRIVYLRNTTSVQIIRVWRSERLLKIPDEEA